MNSAPTGLSQFAHQRYRPGAEVESFYHLLGCDLAGRPCSGTACFVARNARQEPSPDGEPRIYCLGRCFEAPATGLSESRPRVEIHAREAVVLSRLANGGARTLASYRASGGYGALEKAFAASPEAVLDGVESSGLRGRGARVSRPGASGGPLRGKCPLPSTWSRMPMKGTRAHTSTAFYSKTIRTP